MRDFRWDVFLSHRSSDKPFVEMLATRLEVEERLRPFLDKWHLVPGNPWQEELEEALDNSATCAVFLGEGNAGPWAHEEMRTALDLRVRKRTLRVLPVLLPGADPNALPLFLQRLGWVDYRGGPDDASAFRRFVAGIRGIAPGRDGALPPLLVERLSNGDSEERRAAAEAIGRLGDAVGIAVLGARYGSEADPTVRHWIVLAIGEIGGAEATALLEELKQIETDRFALDAIHRVLKGDSS